MDNSWNMIALDPSRSRNNCIASVGHFKLSLSDQACRLVNNCYDYSFAYIGTKEINGEMLIGVELSQNDTGNGFHLTRKTTTNKQGKSVPTGGFELTNKKLILNLFGEEASGKVKHYRVTKDNYNPFMIVIHVPR